jgi:hypothetical protein
LYQIWSPSLSCCYTYQLETELNFGLLKEASVIVTLNDIVEVFPDESVALHVTMVVEVLLGFGRYGKVEPAALLQVTGIVPSTLSFVVGDV